MENYKTVPLNIVKRLSSENDRVGRKYTVVKAISGGFWVLKKGEYIEVASQRYVDEYGSGILLELSLKSGAKIALNQKKYKEAIPNVPIYIYSE